MNLLHIESRSSKRSDNEYEFIVECETDFGNVGGAMEELRDASTYIQIISRNYRDNKGQPSASAFYEFPTH